jgi:hypothetical protein
MKKLLRSLLPALLFMLLFGLQSAMGCTAALGTEHYSPKIQVNACHFHIDLNTAYPCCDSAACHRNSSPVRHFGSPEFANQIKDLLPLILESRQQIPQQKTALAFTQPTIDLQIVRQEPVTAFAPRHALAFLRTTVLLH